MEINKSRTVDSMTTDELKAEIAIREAEIVMSPQLQRTLDFTRLIKMVQNEVGKMARSGRKDDDFEHHVYESVMDALYGQPYWNWITKMKE